jgi:hypothetical protein
MDVKRWITLLALALLLGAGCRLGGNNATSTPTAGATPTQPAATSTVAATAPATPGPQTPGPSRTPPPGSILVQPPDAYLVAQSGEQKASFGAFYWVHETGYAAEVTSRGFEIQPEPLAVQAGETVQVELRGGPAPEKVALEVFPEEGNKDRIAPQEGAMVAFIPRTGPVASAELAGSDGRYSWVTDVLPGNYFVRLRVEWPEPARNPVPGRKPMAEYSFYMTVQ